MGFGCQEVDELISDTLYETSYEKNSEPQNNEYRTAESLAEAVIGHGGDGVAVVSAIVAAADLMQAAGDLKQIIDEAEKS